jgi:hypothetical protein
MALSIRKRRDTPLLEARGAHAQADPGTNFQAAPIVSPERREALIAQAAYLIAERRGFNPGHELDDWYVAAREIDAQLTAGSIPPQGH